MPFEINCRKRRVDETTKTVVTIASPDVNDGYTWRKYGSKQILGSNYPRSDLCVKKQL